MTRIALVTSAQFAALTADDQLLQQALRQRGHQPEAVVWNDPAVNWSAFDLAILRSTWDYHYHPVDFSQWLMTIDQETRLLNPPELVRWNMHKSYIQSFASKGINTVSTIWFQGGDQPDLQDVLQSQGWQQAVVKPSIAASAYHTWRTSIEKTDDDHDRFLADVASRDTMVQVFLPAIQSHGEWSFIFFAGEFSHAILKQPDYADFRVQKEYGGSYQLKKPADRLLDQATQIIQMIDMPWLYARVDGVEVDGNLTLMELELIEPALFLSLHEDAPSRFASAIEHLL